MDSIDEQLHALQMQIQHDECHSRESVSWKGDAHNNKLGATIVTPPQARHEAGHASFI